MARKVNGNEPHSLTPQQIDAIGHILAGRSGRETAAAVGVTPETVSRWRHTNATFSAALNVGRAELAADTSDAIRQLRRRAVDVVSEALNDADTATRYKVALAVLRLDVAATEGPQTPEQTALAWRLERHTNLLDELNDFARPSTLVLPYAASTEANTEPV